MDKNTTVNIAVSLLCLCILDLILFGFHSAQKVVHRLESEKKAEDAAGNGRKRVLQKILEDHTGYRETFTLSALIGNSVILLYVFDRMHSMGAFRYLISGILIPAGILVFGIQIPEKLGNIFARTWAAWMAYPVYMLKILLLPLVILLRGIRSLFFYLFQIGDRQANVDVTEKEIMDLLQEGHEHGVIQQTEAEMITNIFEFSDKEAKDIMTHRQDVVALDGENTLGEAVAFMLSERNSRFPVYEEDIDHITGIVHMRDALKYREEHTEDTDRSLLELKSIIRQPVYVTETKNIDLIFRQMQKEKLQMVIVIDEYGQTSGLIAMEDILEEIVGNIMDEYDVDENNILSTANKNEFLVDGRTPLEEIGERFGLDFEDDRYETLNGFMISQMDRIPRQNEHYICDYGGYRFHVIASDGRRVKKVLLTKLIL